MSGTTMSFSLPEPMRDYIDGRVRSGSFGNTSEYLRELVRRDQDEEAKRRLRALVTDGLESGVGRRFDRAVEAELRARALGHTTA